MSERCVRLFDDKEGCGFIQTEDERDVFLHGIAIVTEGFRSLSEGDRVSC